MCFDPGINMEHHPTLEFVKKQYTDSYNPVILCDNKKNIVFTNHALHNLTGYTAGEMIHKTPKILQGPLTYREDLITMQKAHLNETSCTLCVINYTKQHVPFLSILHISRVSSVSGLCFAFMTPIKWLQPRPVPSPVPPDRRTDVIKKDAMRPTKNIFMIAKTRFKKTCRVWLSRGHPNHHAWLLLWGNSPTGSIIGPNLVKITPRPCACMPIWFHRKSLGNR